MNLPAGFLELPEIISGQVRLVAVSSIHSVEIAAHGTLVSLAEGRAFVTSQSYEYVVHMLWAAQQRELEPDADRRPQFVYGASPL